MAAVADLTGPIRILVVDDDPLVRAGLVMILGSSADVTVVGEAADGTEVAAAINRDAPHVVLMDIRMPKLDGLAATELVRSRPDPPEVIVLTTFHADEQVLHALRAGASGFLLKDTAPAEILRAISRVAAGEPFLSPEVTRQLIAHISDTNADARKRYARGQLGRQRWREPASTRMQSPLAYAIGCVLFGLTTTHVLLRAISGVRRLANAALKRSARSC